MGHSTAETINDGEARTGVCVPHGLAHRTSKDLGTFALTLGCHAGVKYRRLQMIPIGFLSCYFSLEAKVSDFLLLLEIIYKLSHGPMKNSKLAITSTEKKKK